MLEIQPSLLNSEDQFVFRLHFELLYLVVDDLLDVLNWVQFRRLLPVVKKVDVVHREHPLVVLLGVPGSSVLHEGPHFVSE